MKHALILLPCLLLAACGTSRQDAPSAETALSATPEGALVATVNGETISEPLLTIYAKGRGLDPEVPQQREQALQALIDTILLAQAALASELGTDPEAKADAALLRVQYLAGREQDRFRNNTTISDEQVQSYYQEEIKRSGDTEWLLEHILFADEASALAAATRASAGEDFHALMKTYEGSALQAKPLGWANRPRLPSELADAAADLPDGTSTPVPVKSQYGWHVLRRVESRPFTPPDFETVKEGARRRLIEQAVTDYLSSLRAKGEVASGASTPAGG